MATRCCSWSRTSRSRCRSPITSTWCRRDDSFSRARRKRSAPRPRSSINTWASRALTREGEHMEHRLDPSLENVHWGFFDAKLPPRLTVDSGDTVVVDTVSGTPEVAPERTLYRADHYEIVTKLKPQLGPHILTGPIAVR